MLSAGPIQLFCDPDVPPVDVVPCLWLWRVCFFCCVADGSVTGAGAVLVDGVLCSGDAAGAVAVWAKAGCKEIARAISETHANVFFMPPCTRAMPHPSLAHASGL